MKFFDLGDVLVWWIEAYFLVGPREYIGGELSRTFPMRSGVWKSYVIGPLLFFFLFMNDLLDALEVLMLLFEDDVKTVTPRTQNMNLHSYLIAS